jgi:hypothetical protein
MNSITTVNITMDNKVKAPDNKVKADNKVKIIVKKSKLVIKKSKKSIETDKSEKNSEIKNVAAATDGPEQIDQVDLYLKSLTDQEKQTLDIARSHLGTSFNIKRSIGFLNWKSNQNQH